MPFRSKVFPALTAAVLYLFATNSFAADLFELLKRMSDADQKQNYQGTFILRKSDKLSSLHVTHGVDDEGVWESLETLNGEHRKVIRHNNRVVSIYPNRKLVTIRHSEERQSLHQTLPDNIDQLELFYSMSRLDDGRIANHPTLVVDLLPKDQYRYGYRYWVDKNTGMLLRCDLVADGLSENKTVIEQMMFTSLDYLADTPVQKLDLQQFERYEQQLLNVPEADVQQQSVAENSAAGWQIEKLPEGFMLTQSTMRHSQPVAGKGKVDLLHLVYSDGLASVSVFIEKNQTERGRLQGASSVGAINAFGNAVGNYFVTVVGEVPVKTVKLMAQSTVKRP